MLLPHLPLLFVKTRQYGSLPLPLTRHSFARLFWVSRRYVLLTAPGTSNHFQFQFLIQMEIWTAYYQLKYLYLPLVLQPSLNIIVMHLRKLRALTLHFYQLQFFFICQCALPPNEALTGQRNICN